jgi:DNA repair protein RadC
MPFSLSRLRAKTRSRPEAGRLRPLTAALRHEPEFRASRPDHIKDDDMDPLYIRSGTKFRKATCEEVIAHAQALISQRFHKESAPLATPALTREFLRVHLGGLDHEVFGMMYLDSGHRLIKAENLFRGTLNIAMVHVREVLQSVLAHRAASVILYHNHPSGRAEPSLADEDVTQRIRRALALIEVKVIDHLIVAETVFSFAEAGML